MRNRTAKVLLGEEAKVTLWANVNFGKGPHLRFACE